MRPRVPGRCCCILTQSPFHDAFGHRLRAPRARTTSRSCACSCCDGWRSAWSCCARRTDCQRPRSSHTRICLARCPRCWACGSRISPPRATRYVAICCTSRLDVGLTLLLQAEGGRGLGGSERVCQSVPGSRARSPGMWRAHVHMTSIAGVSPNVRMIGRTNVQPRASSGAAPSQFVSATQGRAREGSYRRGQAGRVRARCRVHPSQAGL